MVSPTSQYPELIPSSLRLAYPKMKKQKTVISTASRAPYMTHMKKFL